jgi:mRNA-degrading endonuclease RelE of RelBE toxin-antitoxin system
VELVRTTNYERRVKDILTKQEQHVAEDNIAHHPKNFPVIPGTGGIRKARASRGNRGKSGGARIVFYFWQLEDIIFLLGIYAKNDKEDLTMDEKVQLKSLVGVLIEVQKEKMEKERLEKERRDV